MAIITIDNQTLPSTPASGKTGLFVDSTTKKLLFVDDAGAVGGRIRRGHDQDRNIPALLAGAERVVTFSPYRDPEDMTIHDPQAMTGGPFLWSDALPRKRGGYPISIYRIHS